MKIIRKIVDIFSFLSIIAMLAMLATVLLDVFMRYFLHKPIVGAYEVTQMLMSCLAPSMGVCLLEKRHIWVDLLTERMSRLPQMITDVLTLAASVIMLGLISWQSYNGIISAMKKGTVYTMLKIPQWPFRAIFFVGMLVTFIASIVFFVERMQMYKGGKTPNDFAGGLQEEGGNV